MANNNDGGKDDGRGGGVSERNTDGPSLNGLLGKKKMKM